jgi:hypothetical protein
VAIQEIFIGPFSPERALGLGAGEDHFPPRNADFSSIVGAAPNQFETFFWKKVRAPSPRANPAAFRPA